MNVELRVLILADSARGGALLRKEIERAGCLISAARVVTLSDFSGAIEFPAWHLILCDGTAPDLAPAALREMKQRALDIPFLIVTAPGSDEGGTDAAEARAGDCVTSENRSRLITTIAHALRTAIGVAGEGSDRSQAGDFLAKERARAQLYLDVAGVMMLALDTRGKITLINKRGCEILGYDEDELIGENWFDLCVPEATRPTVNGVFDTLIAGDLGPQEYHENEVLTRDGHRRIVAFHNAILRDGSSRVTGVLCSGEDITERKRVEEELRNAKALLDALMENIPDSIYFKDRECRLVRANRKMLDSLHLTDMAQVIGKTDADLYGEEFARRTLRDDQQLIEGGKPIVGMIERRQLEDGRTNWTSTTKVALRDPNGEITGLVGITREINELMRAQEDRERERKLFLMLMDNIPDRIYFKDTQSRFTEINRALARHFGLSDPKEAIGKTDFDFFAGSHARQAYEDEQAIIRSGRPLVGAEEKEEWPDGRVTWVSTTKMPLRDKEGRIVGTFGVSRDITDRKAAEEALIKAEQKYRSISENSLQGIYQSTPGGRFLFANPSFARMLGYESPEELLACVSDIGQQLFKNETDRSKWQVLLEERGAVEKSEVELRRKDGSLVWVSENTRAVRGADGALLYYEGTAEDITLRKQAEEALRESEERYRSLFENMPEGYAYCRMISSDDKPQDFTFLAVNSTFELQTTLEDVAGRKVTEVLPHVKESNPELFEIFGRVALRGKPESFETYLAALGKWFSVSAYRPRDEHFIAVFSDITERKRGEQALRLFRTLIDQSNDAIEVLDPVSGRFLDMNECGLRDLGYDREELSSLRVFDVDPAVDRPELDKRIKALQKKGSMIVRGFHRRKDGSTFPVEVNLKYVRLDRDYIVTSIRNMTERARMEEALRDSEEKFRSIFEHAFDGISIFEEPPDHIHRRLVDCNARYAELAGRSREELLKAGETQTLAKPLSQDNSSYIDQGVPFRGSYTWLRPDGKDNVIEYAAVPIEIRGKKYTVGIDRDVTEKKLAEEKLRQSEEQFRMISENVSDMIAVLDLDGRRVYNSPSYEPLLGDPAKLRGTSSFNDIHPDDRERITQLFRDTVNTGIGQRAEYRFVLPDGSFRHIESQASTIRDREGRVIHVLVVSRDVTEKKALDQQLLRAQRMESIGRLSSGIAHDLNNVLAPIMMSTDLLRSKLANPSEHKLLDTIATSTKRASDIVKQVLSFGRGVKGERIMLQPRHLISEVVKMASETFPKSIEIRTELPEELWGVLADPTQIHQVLLNMCVNARDAMADGGILTISAENVTLDEYYARMHIEAKPGPHVVVSIADTGMGIPANILDRIFEPFFTTKDVGRGTGLGLSTALAIVKSHGGFINVYSEMRKGTTFRVYLPAQKGDGSVPREEREEEPPRGHGELILVVDDEAAIRDMTKGTLEANGYRVITACDGTEAIAMYVQHKEEFKAVITDMVMPVMDGAATIRALHAISPEVPIIASSGFAGEGLTNNLRDSEVRAFLNKPYTANRLLRALGSIVGTTKCR